MKRIGWMFLVLLGSATLMHAQSSSNSRQMKGTVCDSSCVVQQDNLATCDKGCAVKSGDAVLVGDDGKVMKIANQNICKSHMGQHVKAEIAPTEQQREKELDEKEQYFQVLQMETLEPL